MHIAERNIDERAGGIVREALADHMNKPVRRADVWKGVDRDGEDVLFVDVILDLDSDIGFKDTVGAERIVLSKLNGLYDGLFPKISFYKEKE